MAVDTITAILPDIYEALDVVSREPAGMLRAVTVAASSERASLNQNIQVDIEPAITGVTSTPAMTVPEPAALTPTVATITISNSKAYPFQLSGDVAKGYETGVGLANGRTNRIAQAIRACVNEIETDLAELHQYASRAYGTAGTTPFGSTLADSSQVRAILRKNGAPNTELQLVVDTQAAGNLLGLSQFNGVNTSGNDDALRRGMIGMLHGFDVRESASMQTFTKGTGTSYTSNNAGYAVGATSITLITGSGTVLAGDVVTFAGDSNKYVVTTGVAAPGAITIAAPGLRQAIPASATAMTIGATSTRNMAFHKSAIILAARPVAVPSEGDAAVDRQLIVDPVSGLPLEIALYKGYKMNRYEINLAWGVKMIKPEHTALLLG